MNVEETKKAIKVMQAFVEGAEIEAKAKDHATTWYNATPSWDWEGFDYRIKRQPIEVWAYVTPGGVWLANPHNLSSGVSLGSDTQLVKLREVVE